MLYKLKFKMHKEVHNVPWNSVHLGTVYFSSNFGMIHDM